MSKPDYSTTQILTVSYYTWK